MKAYIFGINVVMACNILQSYNPAWLTVLVLADTQNSRRLAFHFYPTNDIDTINMATRKRGEGIKSVIQKLEDSINAGDYYHAEQMYKTLYYR